MREITDTRDRFASDPLPEGTNRFVVAAEPKKKMNANGNEYWIWRFQWDKGIGDQIMLPNMMGGLLKTLGFKEIEPKKFDWDTLECEGKAVLATVRYEQDKKDPTKTRCHMGDFQADSEIPF